MIPPIATTLRELLRLAAAGGADPAWLNAAGDDCIALLLEVAELRRLVDPRKVRTADLARRVLAANASMVSAGITTGRVDGLSQRFGLSPRRVRELLHHGDEPPPLEVLCVRNEHSESVRPERPARRYGRE